MSAPAEAIAYTLAGGWLKLSALAGGWLDQYDNRCDHMDGLSDDTDV